MNNRLNDVVAIYAVGFPEQIDEFPEPTITITPRTSTFKIHEQSEMEACLNRLIDEFGLDGITALRLLRDCDFWCDKAIVYAIVAKKENLSPSEIIEKIAPQ